MSNIPTMQEKVLPAKTIDRQKTIHYGDYTVSLIHAQIYVYLNLYLSIYIYIYLYILYIYISPPKGTEKDPLTPALCPPQGPVLQAI